MTNMEGGTGRVTVTLTRTFPEQIGDHQKLLRPQMKYLHSKFKQDFQRKSTITHGTKSKMH